MSHEFKRGTSFGFVGQLTDPQPGEIQDLTGYTIESQLRVNVAGRPDVIVADLVAEVIDGPNRIFSVEAATIEETLAWPVDDALFDFVFISAGGDRIGIQGFEKVKIIDGATQLAVIP